MTSRVRNILPPEGVPIGFEIASLGTRFGAQFLDILITFGGLFLLFLALFWIGVLDWSLLATLFLLLFFFIRVPYYIFSELVWNGRTLGKRIVKIRVISNDGGRLTPHQIVARNLMKEVEVFLPATTLLSGTLENGWVGLTIFIWMAGMALVPIINKKNFRLGDMIADTLVVDNPKAVLLPDLAMRTEVWGTAFVFDISQLDIYGRYELQTLEEILRDPPRTPEAIARVAKVAQTIQYKIGYVEKILPHNYWIFLSEFYRQQREHLERRQLFGDARESKFHDKT